MRVYKENAICYKMSIINQNNMDRDKADINDDFKEENIEITGSAKVNVDDEEVVGEKTVDPLDVAALNDPLIDDELETDKMDYEAEEKEFI